MNQLIRLLQNHFAKKAYKIFENNMNTYCNVEYCHISQINDDRTVDSLHRLYYTVMVQLISPNYYLVYVYKLPMEMHLNKTKCKSKRFLLLRY